MAKQNKKTGAARKDKYYSLAKAQGYRARSAFKLIHLNRKYDLLAKSKVVIDLCAAPGGWLQVAEKYCPKQSLLVGVDLDPIKPIPNVTTFVNDITTASCRNQLRGHLKHFQADLVMHDGAPNVGTAWVQDAFTQSELVLQSLKLATEFLKKGGSFVTKVFRSGDYNSLMWVFNQLFSKVEATKPPSSRNVSAEIFVVCQDFLAPKFIDPKFLDPKHVFKELAQNTAPLPQSITSSTDAPRLTNPGASLIIQGQATNVFAPEKKKRQREGYAEGDYTLFRAINVREFINSPTIDDAMRVLSTCNAMTFDLADSEPDAERQRAWFGSRHTTDDVKRDLADLKVLGKGDFKKLMKWRLAIRLEVGLEVRKKDVEDVTDKVEIEEDVDEEQVLTEEMARLRAEAMTKSKREKRKANEKKARTIQRLHLNMTAPEDMTMEDDLALAGEDVFDLGQGEKEIKRRGGKAKTLDAALRDADGMDESEHEDADEEEEEEEFLDSEDEREARTAKLEGALDGLYENYQDRMRDRDAKWKVKQARLRDRNQDSWHGVNQGSDDEDERIVKVQGYNAEEENASDVESEGGWDHVAAQKAKIGEEVDSSDEDSDSVHSDADEDAPKVRKVRLALPGRTLPAGSAAATASRKPNNSLVANLGADVQKAELSRAAQVWFDQSVFKGVGDLAELDGLDEEEEEAQEVSDVEMEDQESANEDDFEVVPAEPEEDGIEWDVEDEDQDVVKQEKIKKKGLLTGEAVTLASALVNRQTTVSQMIDDGFNKHNFHHKDGLPTWFLDDEGKHYKANLPVTKEAMDALRAKQRALDARPIKKVAEAKARKKFKAHQRLEKAKKKAEGLIDAPDMSEKERANQMLKTLGKAGAKPKPKEVKVIVARGANKGLKGRPKGVKGRYKIVDARMRKEMRAMKRKDKATKKRKH